MASPAGIAEDAPAEKVVGLEEVGEGPKAAAAICKEKNTKS